MEKYKYRMLLESSMISLFDRQVSLYLNRGWELYGNPFYANGSWAQAVVLTGSEL